MPKKDTHKTTLYFPAALWREVKIEAIKRNCDATEIVVWAVEAWLAKKGAK